MTRPTGKVPPRLWRAELTYPESGATRDVLPPGYHHLHRRAPLGTGPGTFDSAAELLFRWELHRRAGLAVRASDPVAAPGTVVVLRLGWRWLGVDAPCRVVYTVTEPYRRGFGYGTLSGHPECGEEAFLIERTPDDQVWLDIRAFFRPARLFTRIGGPVGRKVQHLITDRYLAALRTGR